jgi:hypothetical protein
LLRVGGLRPDFRQLGSYIRIQSKLENSPP